MNALRHTTWAGIAPSFITIAVLAVALSSSGCADQHVLARSFPGSVTNATAQQTVNAVYAGEGDYEARSLRDQLDADPRNTHLRLALAAYYQKKGFPDIAIEHGRLACELAPDSPEAHIALARMLRDEHRPGEGAKALSDFAAGHEGEVEVWAWLGVLRDEAGDWKAGETAHRRAIALAPRRDDLLNNLGYCLLEQGRKAEAAEAFRSALKINPHSAIARDNLGLAQADKPAEAVLAWQSISGPAAAHNNLAASLIDAGKYTEARKEIQAALNYDATYAPALSNLRLVSELDGKPAQIAMKASPPKTWSARMTAKWRRLWSGKDRQDNNDSGSPVASR